MPLLPKCKFIDQHYQAHGIGARSKRASERFCLNPQWWGNWWGTENQPVKNPIK
jgi:hypothetical protein